MRRTASILGLVLVLAAVAFAGGKSVKLNGYVIDNMCASGHKSDANFGDYVQTHPKSCALMDGCVKSGYAVLSDSKLYKLDAEGNKRVGELLNATSRDKGLAVTVEGTLEGDTLTVKNISETPATQ